MQKLVETRLQKAILLIGGLAILVRLSGVNYYDTYTAVLQAIGIAVITFALLVFTKDYKPEIHRKIWRILKRYWYVFAFIIIALLAWYGWGIYSTYATAQQFHHSEVDYQNCLDKVAGLSTWTNTTTTLETAYNHSFSFGTLMEVNPYFDEWENAGRPFYKQVAGHWEWGFMNWMMQNHSDFCSEFNPTMIKSFVAEELSTINQ